MAGFILAHLSDPHLAPLPRPGLTELCSKRITGYLNWRRGRGAFHQRAVLNALIADLKQQAYAHLAITGDLVNLALPAEFVRGAQWLATLGAPHDVTLIPGNHDAYVARGMIEARAAWGDYMRGDDAHDGAATPEPWRGFPFVRRRGPVSLIALSSALPTPWFNATGTLGHAQIDALDTLLIEEGKRGAFRIVLVHHPARAEDAHRHKRLTDAQGLADILVARGAELILHGHNHRNMRNFLKGPNGEAINAIGVASASAINDGIHHPATYNLFEIGGAPGAWQCTMIRRGFAGAAPGPVSEIERVELL